MDEIKQITNWMIQEVIPVLKKEKINMSETLLSPGILVGIINAFNEKEITRNDGRRIIKILAKERKGNNEKTL